jgi:hypothetical protein
LRHLGFHLALGIGQALLQHFDAFLGARHVLGFLAPARGRPRRRADPAHVGGGNRLAAEQGAENGAADVHRRLHALLRELRFLALAFCLGALELVLQLQ